MEDRILKRGLEKWRVGVLRSIEDQMPPIDEFTIHEIDLEAHNLKQLLIEIADEI